MDQEETQMKKRSKMGRGGRLLALLLVLAILIAGSFVATKLNPENQDGGEEETETGVSIFTLDADSATALSWTYGEETLSFENTDGAWAYAEDGSFPLDSAYIDAMLSALSDVAASKTIENAEDLSQYGLEEPACAISVTADGSSTEFLLGDETALDGARYLSMGDGNVYLVDSSLLNAFSYGLYDLVKLESIPAMSDLLGLSVESAGEQLEIVYLEDSGLAYSDAYVWFLEQEDGYLTLDTELTEALAETVTGLAWAECVDYHAEEDTLSAYGLDEPSTVTVRYLESAEVETNETDEDGNAVYETVQTEKSFVLELGASCEDGYYARIAGSNLVYLVDSSAAESLLYTTYLDLLPDEVLLMDWDTVTAIDVTLDGVTYEIARETREVTDDDGNTSDETVYTLDGAEIAFEDILDSLDALSSTGGAFTVGTDRSPEIRFVFYRDTDAFSQVELAFYQYNSGDCLVTLDGSSTVFAARDDVAALVESVSAIVSG